MAQAEEGKFTIEKVGPMKSGVSKKTQRPWRTFDLQFAGDPQWYNTFWTLEGDPKEGQELEGKKSYDGEYDSWKFEINRPGGKNTWNPAGANAAVMASAVAAVNGYLGLSPEYLKRWEEKRPKNQEPFEHYLFTVTSVANHLKGEVVKMGGTPEVKTGEAPASEPGDPGPTPPPEIESYPGSTDVDLGGL